MAHVGILASTVLVDEQACTCVGIMQVLMMKVVVMWTPDLQTPSFVRALILGSLL